MSKEWSNIIYLELTRITWHMTRYRKCLYYHCDNGGTPDDFEM